MFFVLSKVLWFLINPGNMLLLLLLLGMALLWTRWRRAGRWLVSAVAVVSVTLAVIPFGEWLFSALEDRFPAVSTPPARVDGIIVAGGIVDPVLSADRGMVSVGGAAERLFEMAALAKKYPRARLVFSGGSGSLMDQDKKEADAVKPLLRQLGIELKRVIFEDKSRNTAENASFSYRLVKPEKGQVWLLVTSAFHMPRAVGSFRQAGWEVIPYPVDYMTRGKAELPIQFNFAGGLGSFGGALHEYLGLLFYWLDGKTDQLFPGPRR